jgi:hypothetical protein
MVETKYFHAALYKPIVIVGVDRAFVRERISAAIEVASLASKLERKLHTIELPRRFP